MECEALPKYSTIAEILGLLRNPTGASPLATVVQTATDLRGSPRRLLNALSPFERGHVPGAINIPGRLLTAEGLAGYPKNSLFVVYCAGPHCNGANKAAVKLAALGYPVKEMIGGVTGWLDEGFELSVTEPRLAREVIGCEC